MALFGRSVLGDVDQRDLDGRVEEAHDRIEEIGTQGAAVVGEKQSLDAMPALAELGHDLCGLGGGGSRLGDLTAAGDVEPDVSVLAEHANRQWLGLGPAHIQPVQGHLIELILGTVFVRRSHDQLLSPDRFGRARHGEERLVGRHDERLDGLSGMLGQVDDRRQELAIGFTDRRSRILGPLGQDRRGHDDDLGRLGIGLGQTPLEHPQVVGRPDRDQFAIGLGQIERLDAELVGLQLIELLEVLVVIRSRSRFACDVALAHRGTKV